MYIPLEETAPPLADQLTLVLLFPVTVAANCWLFPVCSEVAEGEMTTLMPAEGELRDAATMNHMVLDLHPFSGSSMSREFLPVLAMSAAEMVTAALVALTTVVGRREPFHSTTHSAQKLRPVIRRVKPALPAVACAGEKALRTRGDKTGLMGIGGRMGSSARESDTTKVRKTNKTHHFVTGILLNRWFIRGIGFL